MKNVSSTAVRACRPSATSASAQGSRRTAPCPGHRTIPAPAGILLEHVAQPLVSAFWSPTSAGAAQPGSPASASGRSAAQGAKRSGWCSRRSSAIPHPRIVLAPLGWKRLAILGQVAGLMETARGSHTSAARRRSAPLPVQGPPQARPPKRRCNAFAPFIDGRDLMRNTAGLAPALACRCTQISCFVSAQSIPT